MKEFFREKRPHNGLDYKSFFASVEQTAAEVKDAVDVPERKAFTELNYKRSRRVHKTFTVSDELREAVENISGPQLWMVITEGWCGDSAQVLPIIDALAKLNPAITLRILLRDENLDIMDEYLSNGKRGIPKLVAFDSDGNELFTWGPRPKAAASLFRESLAKGNTKDDTYKQLHLWYGRNRGEEVARELMQLLNSQRN